MMRNWLFLSVIFLLEVLCFAAPNKKMEEAYKEVVSLQKKHSLIPLNAEQFNRLARSQGRNFTMFVVFTANDPSRGCQACMMIHSEILLLANSVAIQEKYSSTPQSVFIAEVDFDKAPDAFQLMRLQTAPVFYRFAPTYSRGKEEQCDFNRYGLSAEGLARFISDKNSYHIKIVHPPDYSKIITIAGVVTILALLSYLKPMWFMVFARPPFWSVLVLTFVFSMLSGQMWNQMRNPPFTQRQQDGTILYFSYHSGSQFVAETYIVGSLYALITVAFILLGDSSALLRKHYTFKKYFNICGLVLFTLVFGYLLSIFRSKYGGYPYSFIF